MDKQTIQVRGTMCIFDLGVNCPFKFSWLTSCVFPAFHVSSAVSQYMLSVLKVVERFFGELKVRSGCFDVKLCLHSLFSTKSHSLYLWGLLNVLNSYHSSWHIFRGNFCFYKFETCILYLLMFDIKSSSSLQLLAHCYISWHITATNCWSVEWYETMVRTVQHVIS